MARQIVVEVTGDARGLAAATQQATAHANKFGGVMQGLSAGLGIGLFNQATAAIHEITAAVMESGQAYRDDQVSQEKLLTTLKNTVPHWNGNTAAIEKFASAQARLGFEDDNIRDAMGQLVGITHNVGKAQADVTLAMDLARSKGIDLATATDAIAKAAQGNGKALKSMGIDIHGAKTAAQLLDAVHRNVKGSAEAWANTSEGKLAAAQAKNKESWEKIGKIVDKLQGVIMPAMADAFGKVADAVAPLADKLQPVIDAVRQFIDKNDLLQPILYGLAGVILVTVVPALIAMVAPLLVPIAIMALIALAVAGLKYAWDHNLGGMRDKVEAVWAFIKPILQALWTWLQTNVPNALATAKEKFGQAQTFIGNVFSAIGTFIHNAQTKFDDLVDFVKKLPGRISSAASGMWDGLKNSFRSAINWIIGKWNGLQFKIPSIDFAGQHIPGFTLNMPNIPYFEHGGTMPYTGLAYLHKGETVTPANGVGGNVYITVEHWYGSEGPDLDRFANKIAQRLRFAPGT